MLEPEEVSAMLRLKELGWGTRRIARGLSRNTVRGYIATGGSRSHKRFYGEQVRLKERLTRHRGNADVNWQLRRGSSVTTVERRCGFSPVSRSTTIGTPSPA